MANASIRAGQLLTLNNTWKHISLWGSKAGDSEKTLRAISLNNQLCFLATLTVFFFAPYMYAIGAVHFAPVQLLTGVLCSLYILLNKWRLFKFSAYWCVFVISLSLFFASLEMPGMGVEYFYIPLSFVSFIFIQGSRSSVVVAVGVALLFFLRHWVGHEYVPVDQVSPMAATVTYVTVMSVIFFLCILIIFQFREANRKYEGVITDQMALISVRNTEITDSIHYAKRIQNALLPPAETFKRSFADVFVLYLPKDIVAGDFYWIETSGDKVFFAAADCTGHGVPGAMVSVMCSTSLTRSVKELGIEQPSAILDKTTELLEAYFAKSSEDMKDGMDVALCCFDHRASKLHYAGANNPLYHIRNGALNEVKADKQPVGKHDGRQPFTNHEVDLLPGDCIYIFSDGFADQFGGPNGKKFKYKPFKELLLANCKRPMHEQKRLLEKAVEQWRGQLEQVDDICVIGIRV